ncbi:MAG: hypothetical protein C4589_09845 [Peptococcaceae bacterium]|nr:MAG: hypothetical protein C4589_09845 [Peptococcaceae bacterium]
MATLSVQKISLTGLGPTFVAASAGGDIFANNSHVYLHVKNGDTAAKTVTVNSQRQCDQGFDHDIAVSVPASGERLIGPFNTSRFNNTDGNVEVTYSAVTSVTVAAIELS